MTDETDWNRNVGGQFGRHAPADEYFHGTGPAGDTLTETWYWSFFVPEAAINCFAYCWVHPNLGVVTGGLMIYQGFKSSHLACEIFEMRDFLSMEVVGNGRNIVFPHGLRVDVVVPLEHVRLRFDDPTRKTNLSLNLHAVGAPIMRANNKHFEQVMHATGNLLLRGKAYDVDCYTVRDRSWGELRPEDHAPVPPYTWLTGTFGADNAFTIGLHDDPASSPEWLDRIPAPAHIFKDGWVVTNGNPRRIVRASKATIRVGPSLSPRTHRVAFEDSAGTQVTLDGEIIAQTQWSGWSNINAHLGLVRWNCDGKVGYGASQEIHWQDYVYLMNANGSYAS